MRKSGICIGSCVAPILCDIFLSYFDRDLQTALSSLVINVFRYVDDYLVLVHSPSLDKNRDKIIENFEKNEHALRFTHEVPYDKILQFLDLELSFRADHLCWSYSLRSKKPILDYSSSHSKVVKSGIAIHLLNETMFPQNGMCFF